MWHFAQESSEIFTTTEYTVPGTTGSSDSIILPLVVGLVLVIVMIIAWWKIFTKAGQKGWKAIIPIYNVVIMLRIVGRSGWLVLLLLVPFVNIIFQIWLYYKLSKAFGYGVGMTLLLILYIGGLILGFGKARYVGPDGKPAAGGPPTPSTPLPGSAPAPQA